MSISKGTRFFGTKKEKETPPPPPTASSIFSSLDTSGNENKDLENGVKRLSVSSVAKQLKEKKSVNSSSSSSTPTPTPTPPTPIRPIVSSSKPTLNGKTTPTATLSSSQETPSGATLSSSTPTLPSVLQKFKNAAAANAASSSPSSSPTSSPSLSSSTPPSQPTPNSTFKKPSPFQLQQQRNLSSSVGDLPSLNNNTNSKRPPLPAGRPTTSLSQSYDSNNNNNVTSTNTSTCSSLNSSTSSLPSFSPSNGNGFSSMKPTQSPRTNTSSPVQFTSSPPLKSQSPTPISTPTPTPTPTPNNITIKPAPKRPALPPRNELQSQSGTIVVPKLKPTVVNQNKPQPPTSPSNDAQRLFLKKVIKDDEDENEKSSDEDEQSKTKSNKGTVSNESSTTSKNTTTNSTSTTTTSNPTSTSTSPSSSTSNSPTISNKKPKDPNADKIQRNYLVQELLSTEKKYVNNLNRIITIFLLPLRNKANSKDKILSIEEINQIFSNIETIFNVHKTFLVDFENRIERWTETSKLGEVFIKMSPYLKSYKIYSNAYNGSMLTIRSLMKSNPQFSQFLQKCLEKPASKGLNLSAYLIMPIQRIPRYRLLLESIIKHTPTDHLDYDDLVNGNLEISKSANEIDEKLAQYQIAHKVLDIQNSLNGLEEDIVTPTRHFLKEGDLKKISDRVVNNRHFFLFNDLLIYCKKEFKKDTYRYKATFPLLQCWVKDIPDTQRYCNLFQIISKDKTYFLSAPSNEEKLSWMKLLNEVIDRLVNQNPECIQQRQSIYERRGSMSPQELFNALDKNKDGENGPNARDSTSTPIGSEEKSDSASDLMKSSNKTIWLKDQMTKACMLCTSSFTMTRRRHHCRKCGKIFCNDCCPVQDLSQYIQGKKVRICKVCMEEIQIQLTEMSNIEEIKQSEDITN